MGTTFGIRDVIFFSGFEYPDLQNSGTRQNRKPVFIRKQGFEYRLLEIRNSSTRHPKFGHPKLFADLFLFLNRLTILNNRELR